MGFADRTVIVTGAATGIGAAIAAGFAREGATTYGFDIAWESGATTDDGVRCVHVDLTDEQALHSAVAAVEDDHGAIDVLINNAALSGDVEPKPFEQIGHDEWVHILTNNTLAPFNTSKAVVPGMRRAGYGRIVNLSSGTAFTGVPNALAYVSSKGAIVTMTRALAKELGPDGITVNSVAPGLTVTDKMSSNAGWPQEVWDRSVQNRSIKRPETAEDLVGACLFFAGDGAAFVSGQTLVVDGGYIFH